MIISYFSNKTEVTGLTDVINIIPIITVIILGIKITEKFDIPEILMAVTSSLFFIFKKNQIPDINTINGIMLYNKLGTTNNESNNGI